MKKALKSIVIYITFSIGAAWAGSYEDFFQAIKRDDVRTVQALLARGFDPNVPDPSGQRALFLALREPAPGIARVLAQWKSTQVDVRNAADETPLMMAALKGQLDVATLLIERGADVNKTGWTPLHYAATGGHAALVRLLLEHHAYIDAGSPNGSTPLMMAAQYGTPGVVKLLLEEGADPTVRNQLGISALDVARNANRPEAVQLIQAYVAAWRQKYPESRPQ